METQMEKIPVEEMIDKEKSFLWSQAMVLTRRSEDAEDLFQDTLMKACSGYEHFKPDTNFRAWARKIMINTHINKLRRKDSGTIFIDDISSGEYDRTIYNMPYDPMASNTDSPEKIFFQNHIDEKIMQVIHSLPQEFQQVFKLYHFEGYTYEDISRALGIPVGTVKSRIFRARQCLYDAIGPLKKKNFQH